MSASTESSPPPPRQSVDPVPHPDDGDGVDKLVPTTEPTTIHAWRSAQLAGGGLARLCSLVAWQRSANSCSDAWVSLATDEHIKEQWETLYNQHDLPLYGVPFAVEDNIEAKGFNTTATSPRPTKSPTSPAASDATVVARLKTQGAILIGKTKLDHYGTGSVGNRSSYGFVPSTDPKRVSVGSGSATVVTHGVVPFALGAKSDGSGLVPAALSDIYGLKPTRGALSLRGVVSDSKTLDCVSMLTSTVDDAETVLSLAEGCDDQDASPRSRSASVQSSETEFTDFGGAELNGSAPLLAVDDQLACSGTRSHSAAYAAALEKARRLGWILVPRNFNSLFCLGRLLVDGPWAAESYDGTEGLIDRSGRVVMDPTGRINVVNAETSSAADALAADNLRQQLTQEIVLEFQGFDGIILPTVATCPASEKVAQDLAQQSSKLGTSTGFVNFLDWCAITFPAGFRQDNLPFGLTLVSGQRQEHKLIQLARQWVAGKTLLPGITYLTTTAAEPTIRKNATPLPKRNVELAVVGVRLNGFALNRDLTSRGAKLDRVTTTSAPYRLYALNSSASAKVGLRRIVSGESGGCEIDLEIWSLPNSTRASLATTIGPPFALGSVELQDGSWVCGIVYEAYDPTEATEITNFRVWEDNMAKQPIVPVQRRHITRVLIANRGEIAVRIIKTLRKMNIEAVAIYSDIDADTAHVRDSDVALRLKGQTVAETYLNAGQILALAKSVSADAIIPGYGFLAENASFARSVEAEGMVWVGPTPVQMSKLGLKHRARYIAAALGIPVVPGSSGPVASLEHALSEARRIGFPLMLKSSAGGGGIGLKRCDDISEFQEAFQSVQRLAAANFGNKYLMLERFILRARHVEFQILGEGTGRVLSAGERDCSLQRRHQKVVEESPALMVPTETRVQMRDAATRLTSALKYRNVGTVEFLYDMDTRDFYLLEVNTRLQVEHPITEAVTGLDLVEAMIQIAADGGQELFRKYPDGIVPVTGVAIEARLYAEDPLQNFRPAHGRVLELEFPLAGLRVDTWISSGTEVSTSYDPMLAKLIAKGKNRREAVARLADGLAATRVVGLETNLDYLRQLVASPMFQSGCYTTKSLDDFRFTSASFRVVEPGCLTTVQDWPGRKGYWSIGVPPSGPMDDLSLRIANRLVGNPQNCAGLECTMTGPSLTFHCGVIAAVLGASVSVHIDEKRVPMNQALFVPAGSTLKAGSVESGSRFYIAVRGGIDIPRVMGSRSTFELGQMGGFAGRKLQRGDIIPLGDFSKSDDIGDEVLPVAPAVPIPPKSKAEWKIGVVPGPHVSPDFFTVQGLASLFDSDNTWTVHYNSNRLGIRLKGPRPQWARQDGGKAGLHPSNIHDSPYSIGSISFTGDDAVVLTCDGPSLGGFVVFCVVASAEMWKLGQVQPGDTIRLLPISVEKALELNADLVHAIENLTPLPSLEKPEDACVTNMSDTVVLGTLQHHDQRVLVRQAGDSALLLEFGDASDFNLRQSFEILAFIQHHQTQKAIPGVEELTPGVCTLHVKYSLGTSHRIMMGRLALHIRSYTVPNQVPSRRVRLPLAFDDALTRAAIERYAATIRTDAPWVPSNIDFLAKLNGIDKDVLRDILESSEFLVLGLGDVYLGSPCAVPLDPRHRLFGTKYNPSRTFTPKGAVGIGGQYMCTDSPGGYQLIGRTVDNIWDPSTAAGPTPGNTGQQCLLRMFDRITFYPVTEAELDAAQSSGSQRQLVRIEDGVLDLEAQEAWEDAHRQEIVATAAQRDRAIVSAPFLDELVGLREDAHATNGGYDWNGADDEEGERDGCEIVKAGIPGRFWRLLVEEGDEVKAGSVLANLESCKMEVKIMSPVDGVCVKIYVKEGAIIDAHDTLMLVRPHSGERSQDI